LVGSLESDQIKNFLENVERMTTILARSDETFSILLENLLCSDSSYVVVKGDN
jgi:hypothetical protein